MILCIETATRVCSVALCSHESVVSIRENHENKSHAALLTVFISDILKEQGMKPADLKAVAVSKGPGSYTGLRIGVSAAKGLAYGSSIPLIGIDTTLSMFHGMKRAAEKKKDISGQVLFCPMIDARRMEVFNCMYDGNGNMTRKISAEIITETSFKEIPENCMIIFAGDGALKCREIITHKNSVFYYDFTISAADMRVPAFESLSGGHFEDVAYFEPFYLKDFIATVPRKLL